MTKIYFIRHAQASIGSSNYDRLSPLGNYQSIILADYLKKLGIVFDAVYSGEMERQRETARPLIESLFGVDHERLIVLPEFNEYDAHSIIGYQIPEMTKEDPRVAKAALNYASDGKSLELIFKKAMLRWIRGERLIPGVETWLEFVRRVKSGIEKLDRDSASHKTVAVFTSGGAISVSMKDALGLNDEQTVLLPLRAFNTGITLYHFNEGRLMLSYFNSIAHLEMLRKPKIITYR
ncbi:MAG: histidine phosphatase family protein [Pseudomonadota bacterium]